MRSYGKQMVRRRVEQMQNTRIESRDAVITAIDFTSRTATVRIQGSDKSVYARWSENFEQAPQFLRVGNAVRISHPEGNQGRIEIIGHGVLIPTTVSGGAIPQPPTPQGDGIVWGATAHATTPTASMTVVVDTGEIRISGIEYALNTLVMGSGLPVMGSGTPMGAFSGSVTLDAASSTQFRYDLIVAGVDGSVHAVKGTDATMNPVMPLLPAAHVRIAHVLVHPNLTAVENHDINALYTTPAVSTINFAFDITTLHGHSIVNDHFDDHAHLTLQVRDQYGNKIGKASPGHVVKFGFTRGNGDMTGAAVFDEGSGEQTLYTTDGEITMTYTRQGTYTGGPPAYAQNGEVSPSFYASTFTVLPITADSSMIQLWDDFDNVKM